MRNSIIERKEYLQEAFSFWDKMTEEEKTMLSDHAVEVKYEQGQTVHNAEKECIGILAIKSGELRIYILSEDGKEVTLYRLGAGEVCVLSASCVLKNITFDVQIDAEKDTEAILVNSQIFSKLCNSNIYVEAFSLRITAERFSDVMWAMEQILFLSFDKRLAIFLLDEAAKNGTDNLALTHEQIAKYMGSAREVVSRMLKYFAKEEIVKLSRGNIQIIDKKKLKMLI